MRNESDPTTNERLVRGGVLIAVASVLARAASFLAQLVLGRLLVPEDFGLYAIALTFTTLAAAANSVLRSFLVDALKREWDFDGLYRLVMWVSVAVAVAAAAASPLIARPFGEDGLQLVLLLLFLAMPIQVAPAFGAAKLTNALRYGSLSSMWTWSAVIRQVVTVLGALLGFGAVSFVVGVYAGSLAELIMVRHYSGPYPRLRGRPSLDVADVAVLRFVPASIVVLALWINGDYASAGLFESAAVVGVYFFAYQLTTALTMPFTLAVSSVLLPSFTSGGQTGERTSQRDRDGFRLTVLFVPLLSGLPFGLLAVLAAPLTDLVWSREWNLAIGAIVFLGLATPMKLLLSTSLSILQARGDWRGYTRLLGISSTVTVLAAAVGGLIGGVNGLVAVISLANIALGLAATALVGTTFGFEPSSTIPKPVSAWLIWVFAVSVTTLAEPIFDVGWSSVPTRVLVYLLSGVPIAYTIFGDELTLFWQLVTRQSSRKSEAEPIHSNTSEPTPEVALTGSPDQ